MSQRTKEALTGIGFIAIWIIGFLVFTLYPMIQTLWLSLNDVRITPTGIRTEFIGIGNYRRAFFEETAFIDTVVEYLSQLLVYIPVIVVLALMIAMLLNTKLKGRGIFRTIFFLPVIITSGPVISQLVEQKVVSLPGIENFVDVTIFSQFMPAFLANTLSFFVNSFVMILWFSGIQILIFLAVLQKLDRSMYEAASIDGASAWETFWKITLPALGPSIVIVVVFTIVMQSVFSLNPIIVKISADMFKTGFGYGFASAMAWILFGLMVIIICMFMLFNTLLTRKNK